MAYLGAALAFETKGIPAAAFAVASILFLLLNPWKRVQLKKLIAPAAIPVSVVIALSWYILMVVQHGNTFVDTFFADQVGDRVSSKLTQILTNGILGILNLFLFFIPWVILFLSKPGQLKKEIVKSKTNVKAILGFVASWVVLIVLMSASVFKFYDRYILPCIPLVALVLAYSIVNFNTAFRKPVFKVFAGINLAVLLIALLYLLFISQNAVLILGVVAGLVLNILYFLGIFRKISKEILIANAVMLIYFTGHILLYPLLMPVPAKQLVVSFKEHLEHEKDPVYVYGHIGIPANVRVQGHAELNIISMDTVYVLPETPNHIIAFKEKEKQRLNLENYDIYPGSEEWSDVPAGKFPPFLRKPVENLKNRGTKYFIGKPKQ
jgi:4-amino-4-deoxy-L-arabinose transferase-like glycosyltransferase